MEYRVTKMNGNVRNEFQIHKFWVLNVKIRLKSVKIFATALSDTIQSCVFSNIFTFSTENRWYLVQMEEVLVLVDL